MLSDLTVHDSTRHKLSFNAARLFRILLQILLCSMVLACSTTKSLTERTQVELPDGFAAYERGDYQQSFELLKPLAQRGDAEAQTKVGNMYYLGLGVQEDDEKAAKWFEKAVQQGDLEAHVMLGTLYVLGAGVPQDYSAAVRLLRVPAERGIGGAQFMLGTLYMYGRGAPENRVEAYKWLSLSADRGSRAAKDACALLSPRMTKKEMAAAQALLKVWQPQQTGRIP